MTSGRAPTVELHWSIGRFRLASRELFNHYFLFPDRSQHEQYLAIEQFRDVEQILFKGMVTLPCGLREIRYGHVQGEIAVHAQSTANPCPVMVNREISSGYWDFPIDVMPKDADLRFVSFFDWAQLAPQDHQYVRATIFEWPGSKDLKGKHVLIETRYVEFLYVHSND